MASLRSHPLRRFLGRIGRSDGDPKSSDAELVANFASQRDEDAFSTLMNRHGAMVLGVCARVLGDSPDVEDAFQATFLVFAKRAAHLTRPELLGNWLYGVAYRTALRARTAAARRRTVETRAGSIGVVESHDEPVRSELRQILDRELNRLPERYRTPLVLCDLEGQTQEEVARRLGCPRKTITTRLARGRERLRVRLERSGFAVSLLFWPLRLVRNPRRP